MLHDPLTPEEHVNLGVSYEKRGELDGALKEYEAAARNMPLAYLYVGNVCFQQKRFQDAERAYKKAIKKTGSPEAYNNLAWLYYETNADLEEAERLAAKAVDLSPGSEAFKDTLRKIAGEEGAIASPVLEDDLSLGLLDELADNPEGRSSLCASLLKGAEVCRIDGDEEAARGLGVEEDVHVEGIGRSLHALSVEIPIPVEPSGDEPGSRQFHGFFEIGYLFGKEAHPYRLFQHLREVTREAETRDVGGRVGADGTHRLSRAVVQGGHHLDGFFRRILSEHLPLDGRVEDARAEGLGQDEEIPGSAPTFLRILSG